MNKRREPSRLARRKPKTYLLPSCILMVLLPIESILCVFFLVSAWLTKSINEAYYSGNEQRAKELSKLARNFFIAGCVSRVMMLSVCVYAVLLLSGSGS